MTSQRAPRARRQQARKAFQKHYPSVRRCFLFRQTFQREGGFRFTEVSAHADEKGKTNGTCRAWGSRCRRDIFKKWGKGERERERMLKGTRFENSLGQYRDSTAANVHTHTERCKNPTTGEKQTSINKDVRISACTAHARSPKHNAGV